MRDLWRRLGSDLVYDAGIFRLRRDAYEYRGEAVRPYYVLESPPWINVVAVTDEDEVVLVRQYRHGLEDLSLEVPGGVVDPGDADPAAGAERELLEETGYAGGPLRPLGAVSSNPAILTNRTHCYATTGARRVAEPSPDEQEDLEVELCPVERIPDMLKSGEIHHALSVCALGLFLLQA